MRVLLTGASGLLGANFLLQHSASFDLLAAACGHPILDKSYAAVKMNLADPEEISRVIQETRPQAIVHAAAMTGVDGCEDDPIAARLINAAATEQVARAAQEIKADLIYISTDYVFDGQKGMYTEEDLPHPLGVYAWTKWEGEQFVLDVCPTATIARTTLYGWNAQDKHSFAERILTATPERPATAFTDMYWSPILANDLADAVAILLKNPTPGIFHVAGKTRCSRHDFAQTVLRVFGKDLRSVRPGLLKEATLKAPRPADASLDVSLFERKFQHPLPGLEAGLRRMKTMEEAGWVRRLKGLLTLIPA
ncbi:MAG: dTDP-4-dehydrorhamnose reductase [Candidatus Omnitrophica bacterium]|nr:dTDP-4-dehydrorhamnose reductase [Candidatus Omnitrophota bacterium]